MPGAPPEDVLSRIVFVSQLFPTVAEDHVRTAFSQLGTVRKVKVAKNPLNPGVNMVSWCGASALVEMETSDMAKKAIKEADTMFMLGLGPRPVSAQPAGLPMLDPQDWPEAFQERPRLRLVEVGSSAQPKSIRPGSTIGVASAGPRQGSTPAAEEKELMALGSAGDWLREKEQVKQHVQELALLQDMKLQEHRELHVSEQRLLDKELQKVRLTSEAVERDEGAIRALAGYYGISLHDNAF